MQRSLKISLCLIVKPDDEEARKLDTCLNSCAEFFDEICITQAGDKPNKKVSDKIKKHHAKESFYQWDNDFASARNYNFSQATGDWIFWLDADDILKDGHNLREAIELAHENNVSGLSLLYWYKVKGGKVEDSHWKVQAVKNDGHAEWKGLIHEDLLPKRPADWASIKNVIRVHTATDEDSERSLRRNIEMLEGASAKEPDEPRHYFYMARCHIGLGEFEKVIEDVQNYLDRSDWKRERYEAWNMAGEAFLSMHKYDESLRCHNDAILEFEEAPDAYIYKARAYIKKEEWENAITALNIAKQRDVDSALLKKTALYDHDLFLLESIALLHVGKYKAAKLAAERAHKARQTDKSKELMSLATDLDAKEDLTLHYFNLCKHHLADKDTVRKILETAPREIQDDPRLLKIRFGAEEPRVWPKNSVAIFCGNSLEDWDGNSVKKGGIGGSETAVIEIAKRLVKKGMEVTVFNRCGAYYDGKVIDGVTYKNFWQFNKEDTFNVVWLWRSPALLEKDIKANKVIVDMHDVSSPDVFYDKLLDKIDTIAVKTNYHRSLYPDVPDEKFTVIPNGVDLARYDKEVPKIKNKFIYTSTQNRGLEQLCQMWPRIKAAIPEAELHTFYGWETFYETHRNNPAQLEWMKKMQGLLSQDGIYNHGRVDQDTLAIHQLEAGFWLYPTAFPEIHCITALEMQAARAFPITSGYAALEETQQGGLAIKGDINDKTWQRNYIDLIISSYKNFDKLNTDKGYEWAKENSWDNVAEQWYKIMK